jgi:plastocyanin
MRYALRAVALMVLVQTTLSLMAGCSGTSSGAGPSGPAADTAVTPNQVEERGADASEEAGPNQIIINNFAYRPARLEVAVGTKVTWINRDDVPHTATSTAKPRAFDSRALDTDGHFVHVFTTPGTYAYFCAVHPHMTGEIIVK